MDERSERYLAYVIYETHGRVGMTDLLGKVPLNTSACYVKGITKDGCEIYLPVTVRGGVLAVMAQKGLQARLNTQDLSELDQTPPSPPSFPDPMPA